MLWVIRLAIVGGVAALWWLTITDNPDGALWRGYKPMTAVVNVALTFTALTILAALRGTPSLVRSRLVKSTMTCLAVALIVGTLELPAVFGYDYRLLFGSPDVATWSQLAKGVQVGDPELVFLHKPHSRYVGSVTGNLVTNLDLPSPQIYKVDVAYDHHGFRNDVDLQSADVVVIGDSFVEGAETAQRDTLVAVMARRMGLTAANLGQSGYGPQQELVVLRRYGLPLKPRAVVWVFFGGNDLSNVDEYEEMRGGWQAIAQTVPLDKRLLSVSALAALARLTTPVRTSLSDDARRHAIDFRTSTGASERLYLDREYVAWTPHQWEVATETLKNARDEARRTGTEFLLVYVPRKLSVYRGFIQASPDSFAHVWAESHLPDVLAQWSRDNRIEYLDATLPLRDAVRGGESVHLAEDVHWNAAGHRVVADAIAARLGQMLRAPGSKPLK